MGGGEGERVRLYIASGPTVTLVSVNRRHGQGTLRKQTTVVEDQRSYVLEVCC